MFAFKAFALELFHALDFIPALVLRAAFGLARGLIGDAAHFGVCRLIDLRSQALEVGIIGADAHRRLGQTARPGEIAIAEMGPRLAHGLGEARQVGAAGFDLRRQIAHGVGARRQLRRRHQRGARVIQAIPLQGPSRVSQLRGDFGRLDGAARALQQIAGGGIVRLEGERLLGMSHGRLELAAGDRRLAGRHRRGQRAAGVGPNRLGHGR